MLFEGVEQRRGEAEVAPAEVFGVFGPVYAGEIEYKVGLAAVAVEIFGRRIEVIFENLVDRDGIIPGLAVFYVIELRTEILAYKPLGAGY